MSHEADEAEIRRLRWRCRRGMRELDQLFGRYLDREWRQASQPQRDVFLDLLDMQDDKLWHLFMGHERSDVTQLQALVDHIRSLPP